ncbi:MAG: LacI family DNA-binding transcriptional regulator [Candidatus Merdivicinus sp.]|jgi:LacI family transcriptional regulator
MNIRDIAQKCGVSIATVSRVLNESPHVREETRRKILTVIESEQYTPNAFARGLGLNSMKMAGILCTDISDAYYARAVSLVEKLLRDRGLDTLLTCTGDSLVQKKKALSLLLEKRVDAIILIGSAFEEEQDNSHLRAAAAQVPLILINGWVDAPGISCVLCGEQEAMEDCVLRLAAQGCRNILYLYDAMTSSGFRKLAGYRNGIAKAGIPISQEQIVHTGKDLESAYEAVCRKLNAGYPIDGVLASEDLLAIGAQKALASYGLKLPIIGFNNSVYAQCASPALSSVDNMLDLLCPSAVNLAAEYLSGRVPPRKIVIDAHLIERETYQSNSERSFTHA